jgi:hypothetical protein
MILSLAQFLDILVLKLRPMSQNLIFLGSKFKASQGKSLKLA